MTPSAELRHLSNDLTFKASRGIPLTIAEQRVMGERLAEIVTAVHRTEVTLRLIVNNAAEDDLGENVVVVDFGRKTQ